MSKSQHFINSTQGVGLQVTSLRAALTPPPTSRPILWLITLNPYREVQVFLAFVTTVGEPCVHPKSFLWNRINVLISIFSFYYSSFLLFYSANKWFMSHWKNHSLCSLLAVEAAQFLSVQEWCRVSPLCPELFVSLDTLVFRVLSVCGWSFAACLFLAGQDTVNRIPTSV